MTTIRFLTRWTNILTIRFRPSPYERLFQLPLPRFRLRCNSRPKYASTCQDAVLHRLLPRFITTCSNNKNYDKTLVSLSRRTSLPLRIPTPCPTHSTRTVQNISVFNSFISFCFTTPTVSCILGQTFPSVTGFDFVKQVMLFIVII